MYPRSGEYPSPKQHKRWSHDDATGDQPEARSSALPPISPPNSSPTSVPGRHLRPQPVPQNATPARPSTTPESRPLSPSDHTSRRALAALRRSDPRPWSHCGHNGLPTVAAARPVLYSCRSSGDGELTKCHWDLGRLSGRSGRSSRPWELWLRWLGLPSKTRPTHPRKRDLLRLRQPMDPTTKRVAPHRSGRCATCAPFSPG